MTLASLLTRVSEALALQTTDIRSETLTFRKSTTKGKLKTRVVDIQSGLAALLAEYQPKPGALFPGMRGVTPSLSRFAADKILRDAYQRVGLLGVSTHSFRRTALTMMSSAGIPLRDAARRGAERESAQIEAARRVAEKKAQIEAARIEAARLAEEKARLAEEKARLRAQMPHIFEKFVGEEDKAWLFLRVRTVVSEQLGVDEDDIHMSSHLSNDLGADGLDLQKLVMALEEEFDIEISDEEAENLLNLTSYYSGATSFWSMSSGSAYSSYGGGGTNCIVKNFVDYICNKMAKSS